MDCLYVIAIRKGLDFIGNETRHNDYTATNQLTEEQW